MRNTLCFILLIVFSPSLIFSQGRCHNWLLGYQIILDTNSTTTRARLLIDSSSIAILPETRKMAFAGTQANISDENGNLLIASNGCWIANALGDTMLNGSNLNPPIGGPLTGWCDNTSGLPILNGNLIVPFPGDSTKYVLFHQNHLSIFYSIIDITLDGGLGGVTTKNIPIITDDLNWGFAAAKHGNGRDWWIAIPRNDSNFVYKILLTPDTIASITTQIINMSNMAYGSASPATFSPDGTKFAYASGYGGPNDWHDVRVLTFDRCSGNFDNLIYIYDSTEVGWGLEFSPNSQYLYQSSWYTIYQLNLSTLVQDTVAIYDGFYYPAWCGLSCGSMFWNMYLAANGKIYTAGGGGVLHMGIINYPDSAGLSCDIQQHAMSLPCWIHRSNDVNHPNYYLGPLAGSSCDTLALGISKNKFDFKLSVSPNPNNGTFKVVYLLPQNEGGEIKFTDLQGRLLLNLKISPWSSLQNISMQNFESGIYNCTIISGTNQQNKKLVLIMN